MTEHADVFSRPANDLESASGDFSEVGARENEQRFRTTFENAAVGIAHVAADGRWLLVNKRFCEILGYPREEMAGKTFQDLTHPEDLAADLILVNRMIAGEIPQYSLEKRYIRKDGSIVWVNLTVGSAKKANGSIDYFISVVEDITKRKEAEARLKDSEDRLRRILDNLFSFVGVLAREGILIEANEAPLRAAGLSREDVIGKPFWDCYWWSFSEDSRERLKQSFEQALRGETVRYDVDIRVGERRFITIDFQLAPRRNALGEIVEVIPSATDITDRRRAEVRLRESEADLQLAQDAANLGRWNWDLRTQDLTWTDRCKAFFGAPLDAPMSYDAFLAALHPDDRERIDAAVSEAINLGKDYDVEMRTIWPDGSLHWIASKGRVYFDDGRPRRMMGVAFDITARKQAEEQMSYALREVTHRSKNLLSVVQAIVRQTARTETRDDFVERFSERIRGLAASQDLLVGNKWKGVLILDLIRSQLSHFKDALGSRVRLAGPEIELNASAAQTIGMAVHELATNACKYGALSNETGHVLVDWSLRGEDNAVFSIGWSEREGPPVIRTNRKGFGQTVLLRLAEDALDAEVRLDYDPAGVQWRLRCPAENTLKT